jgi:NACalpha-BTF3-like transcription factor
MPCLADEDDVALVNAVVAMGYTRGRAIRALEMACYDVNAALDALLAEDVDSGGMVT